PVRTAEPPADLDRGSEMRSKVDGLQTDETNKFGNARHLHGPKAITVHLYVIGEARCRPIALRSRQRRFEMLHHLGIGIHPRKVFEIAGAPRAQQRPRGADRVTLAGLCEGNHRAPLGIRISSGQRARGLAASVSVMPRARRSAPAQAIMAPLSVQSAGGGTVSTVPAAIATRLSARRIAWLAATPPAATSAVGPP